MITQEEQGPCRKHLQMEFSSPGTSTELRISAKFIQCTVGRTAVTGCDCPGLLVLRVPQRAPGGVSGPQLVRGRAGAPRPPRCPRLPSREQELSGGMGQSSSAELPEAASSCWKAGGAITQLVRGKERAPSGARGARGCQATAETRGPAWGQHCRQLTGSGRPLPPQGAAVFRLLAAEEQEATARSRSRCVPGAARPRLPQPGPAPAPPAGGGSGERVRTDQQPTADLGKRVWKYR